MKQPISSLTIVSRKQGLFEGLSALLPYIREEINVQDIHHESNVEKYVRLEALPNLPVLGPKFKGNKAFGDIRNAITKLGTAELEEARTNGSLTILGHTLEASDIIIQEKFVNDNVAEHEAIGGDRVIVLLDTRQNEALKTRGFAREIITRVQKLKKKAKLSTEDAIIIFYKFGENAKYLNLAVENEAKTIAHAVKKPFFHFSQGLGAVDLVHDEGTIDDEPYHIKISSPTPIFNFQQLALSFGDSGLVLAKAMLTFPYSQVKNEKHFSVKLDGKLQTLEEGKHYKIVI